MWKTLINMLKNAFVMTDLQEARDKQAVTDGVNFIFVKTKSVLFLIVKHKYNVHDLIVKQ